MLYDASFINTDFPTNKIFTNTVGLKTKTPIANLQKAPPSITKDSFGSTKKTTHYVIARGALPEIETLSRNLVASLTTDLPHKNFEFHVLTKRAEFWRPKGREEDVDFFNAIRFTAVVNHNTNKVWITPILTVVAETPKIIPEESPSELEEEEFLLQPQPLQRTSRRQLNTDE
jgi:hypothetical protein